jgi:hypothetical protein
MPERSPVSRALRRSVRWHLERGQAIYKADWDNGSE